MGYCVHRSNLRENSQVFCFQRYPLVSPHVHGKREADPSLRWKCVGHILKAHGRVYQLFQSMKRKGLIHRKAQISYKNAGAYDVPFRKNNRNDEEALSRSMDFYLGIFAEPIFKTGQYPELVRQEVPHKFLPELSLEDQHRIKGSADFFATVSFR